MPPKRGTMLAAGIPVAIVIAFLVASVVAWIYLGLPSSKFDPFKMPAFFWYYRHDPVVLKAFGAGMVVGLALTGIMLWWVLKRKPPLHGAARFAKEGEIRRAGFRADNGIVVGKERREVPDLWGERTLHRRGPYPLGQRRRHRHPQPPVVAGIRRRPRCKNARIGMRRPASGKSSGRPFISSTRPTRKAARPDTIRSAISIAPIPTRL